MGGFTEIPPSARQVSPIGSAPERPTSGVRRALPVVDAPSTVGSPSIVYEARSAIASSLGNVYATAPRNVSWGASASWMPLAVYGKRFARMPVALTSHGPKLCSSARPTFACTAPTPVASTASGVVADSGGLPVGSVTPARIATPGITLDAPASVKS